MKKIITLNSYMLSDKNPYESFRIKYFLKGLEKVEYSKNNNLKIVMINSNNLNVIEKELNKHNEDDIDLIYAVGTPNADIALKYSKTIPIVYHGAHPESVGKEECSSKNICGIILTLPFTAHYKNFRFLKKLFPLVDNIYIPFYKNTIFCTKIMKEKYKIYSRKYKGSFWIPMDSEYIPYSSLAKLCYIIGIKCFELVYSNSEELSNALNCIDPRGSLIMPYNDSVYCKNAPEILIRSSIEKRIPLLWNNNPEATHVGALVAIAGHFKEVGFRNGKMAGEIFNGSNPSDIGCHVSARSYSSINLKTAKIFNLEFSEEILDYFDEVIK